MIDILNRYIIWMGEQKLVDPTLLENFRIHSMYICFVSCFPIGSILHNQLYLYYWHLTIILSHHTMISYPPYDFPLHSFPQEMVSFIIYFLGSLLCLLDKTYFPLINIPSCSPPLFFWLFLWFRGTQIQCIWHLRS